MSNQILTENKFVLLKFKAFSAGKRCRNCKLFWFISGLPKIKNICVN